MTSEKLGPSFFEVFKISVTTIFVRECLRLIRTLDSQHFRSIAVKKVGCSKSTVSLIDFKRFEAILVGRMVRKRAECIKMIINE